MSLNYLRRIEKAVRQILQLNLSLTRFLNGLNLSLLLTVRMNLLSYMKT